MLAMQLAVQPHEMIILWADTCFMAFVPLMPGAPFLVFKTLQMKPGANLIGRTEAAS